MSNVAYLVTTDTLTFYVGGQPYIIDRQSKAVFDQVVAELNKSNPDADELIRLADVTRNIRAEIGSSKKGASYLSKGVIDVTRTGVTYNGEPLNGALADRLMDILNTGLRIGPWIRFAENLFMNPADFARDELYLWLANSDLPITEDGHFLAYKIVRADYRDHHSGQFDNSVGKMVQLAGGRQAVDDDRDRTCSYGLHFCSKDYLPGYGGFFGANGSRILIVKINPADVVSIPSDYNNSKGRTWRYEVVDETDQVQIDGREWSPVSTDYNEPVSDDYDDYNDAPALHDDYFEEDAPTEQDIAQVQDSLESSHDIVALRRMASKAGLNSTLAWKVYSKSQLARFVAENG